MFLSDFFYTFVKNIFYKHMRKFNIIACINTNLVLGNNGDLLYHIKNDLKTFKSITLNSVIIMGRTTFESLPKRPLPNRINIVITSDKSYKVDNENVIVVNSIEECIEVCECKEFDGFEFFVIGGGKVYQQFIDLDIVDKMYITEVTDTKEGDTYFPNVIFDTDKWRVFYQSETMIDKDSSLKYFFRIYKKYVNLC